MEILQRTCHHPEKNLDYPNNKYGYGEIDALAGADYVKNVISGVISLDDNGSDTGSVCYSLSGYRVDESSVRSGVYIRKVNGRTYKIAR